MRAKRGLWTAVVYLAGFLEVFIETPFDWNSQVHIVNLLKSTGSHKTPFGWNRWFT